MVLYSGPIGTTQVKHTDLYSIGVRDVDEAGGLDFFINVEAESRDDAINVLIDNDNSDKTYLLNIFRLAGHAGSNYTRMYSDILLHYQERAEEYDRFISVHRDEIFSLLKTAFMVHVGFDMWPGVILKAKTTKSADKQ